MLAEIAKPPYPSPLPSALRALMLGRLPGYLLSRCRTSLMISPWVRLRSSGGVARKLK